MIDPANLGALAFEETAAEITAEVTRRTTDPKSPLYNTPATNGRGYLLTSIFKICRKKIKNDEVDKIREAARHYRQSASGFEQENPFKWLLLAYYAYLGPIDDKQRAKIEALSLELFYAWSEHVKPENLVGFLYQNGGASKIRKKLKISHPDLFKRKIKPKTSPKKPRGIGNAGHLWSDRGLRPSTA